MDKVLHIFNPCKFDDCASCTGAYIDFDSNRRAVRVVCDCRHHRQPDFFRKVESKQQGFNFAK